MLKNVKPPRLIATWKEADYEVWLYKWTATTKAKFSLPQVVTSFVPYLYNRRDHLQTQTAGTLYTFHLLNSLTNEVVALFHAVIDEKAHLMWSPPMAPFGGIQYAELIPPGALTFLLDCLDKWALSQRINTITFKTAPAAYQPQQHQVLHQVYTKAGYVPTEQHTNHHISVSDRSFTELLSGAEQRRLRKGQRAGLVARLWHKPDPEVVCTFINKSRQEQGYPLTLPREKLLDLLNLFPADVLVFGVYDGEIIAALTVAIRVSRDIIYNFLPADTLQYRTYSPTVMLNEALYQYCQQEGVKVLDLGISLDHHGQPKPSLARFKERLGGTSSLKITYRKELR